MTEQQQNICDLFNSGDSVNRELAEVLATASGNKQWFQEEILDKIVLIKEIINRYCKTYASKHNGWVCSKEYIEPICLQVFFKGIQMKALYDNDGDLIHYNIWTDDIIIDSNAYSISFQCDENHEYALKEELEELGIKVTIH